MSRMVDKCTNGLTDALWHVKTEPKGWPVTDGSRGALMPRQGHNGMPWMVRRRHNGLTEARCHGLLKTGAMARQRHNSMSRQGRNGMPWAVRQRHNGLTEARWPVETEAQWHVMDD